MAKSASTPVAAKTIRTAFTDGTLDPHNVPALDANGNVRTDKDGNVILADPACIFGKGNSGVVRGRLNPAFVRVYTEATGNTYAEKSVAEGRTLTLPLTKMNAKGARLKRPETFPVAEVRRLAGVEGKTGRLSSASIAKAAAAVEAERGWDTKPGA